MKSLPYTMYEVNHHFMHGDSYSVFTHCSISKITVTRFGILPDCSGKTIDAIDELGRKFQGNPQDYFNTEELAKKEIWRVYKEHKANLADKAFILSKELRWFEGELREASK